MPLMPARTGPSKWKAAIRFVTILVLFLIVLGFMIDVFSGLPISLSSRSWTAWLFGILALGVLYLLGEGGGNWIGARDKITDPLWKRVWHLVVLLGFVVAAGAVVAAIVRMTQ